MAQITEIIEDCLLNNLHCDICKCFLSLAPTFLTSTSHAICGRCQNCCTEPLYINNVYDILAAQFNFPCKYLEQGCEIVSNFSESEKHEKYCPYRLMKCTYEDCQWFGIPIELIIHYQNVHPYLIIEEDCVRELRKGALFYILFKSNFYFILQYERSDTHLALEFNNLTHPSTSCSFTCDLLNFHNCEVTKRIPLSLNEKIVTPYIASNSQLFIISTQLQNFNRRSIKCPQCLQLMTPPILKCPSGHITCADCFDTYYNYCTTCEQDDLVFCRDRNLENEAANTIYTCRWTKCGCDFSIRDIKQHEVNCIKRLYNCLFFCSENWQGSLEELIKHHPSCGKKYTGCSLQTTSSVTFQCKDIPESRELEYHLITYNEMFRLIINFEIWGIKISLINYALPSLYGWYRYEVDLAHTENPTFDANKTLQIKTRTCNIFTLDVIGDELLPFGGYEFLKITVRIILLNATDRKISVDHIYKSYKL